MDKAKKVFLLNDIQIHLCQLAEQAKLHLLFSFLKKHLVRKFSIFAAVTAPPTWHSLKFTVTCIVACLNFLKILQLVLATRFQQSFSSFSIYNRFQQVLSFGRISLTF